VGPAGLDVLFIVRSLGYGGAERQLVELAKGLHRRGHRTALLVYYQGGPLAKELEAAGVEVVGLGKRGRWDLISPFVALRREIRRRKPEILHGYLPDGNLLALLGRRYSPSSRVVWGVRASNLERRHYDWLVWAIFRASCWLAPRADLIISNSEAGRAWHVANGYPADRSIVIPNGIDVERFRPNPFGRARWRSEWGVADGTPVIGLVGRLDPMKDHETFLVAASRLSARRADVRFVCVGAGLDGYQAHLERFAADLGLGQRLIWVPMQDRIEEIYSAIDLLTSSSAFAEGFPNVVGEAMACGVPCVVTDVGDSARVVGDTGLVTQPRNPDALAEALDEGLRALVQPAGRRARQRIEEEFSVDRLVARTESALLDLAGGSAGAARALQ